MKGMNTDGVWYLKYVYIIQKASVFILFIRDLAVNPDHQRWLAINKFRSVYFRSNLWLR